jgi:hypothetical protein
VTSDFSGTRCPQCVRSLLAATACAKRTPCIFAGIAQLVEQLICNSRKSFACVFSGLRTLADARCFDNATFAARSAELRRFAAKNSQAIENDREWQVSPRACARARGLVGSAGNTIPGKGKPRKRAAGSRGSISMLFHNGNRIALFPERISIFQERCRTCNSCRPFRMPGQRGL